MQLKVKGLRDNGEEKIMMVSAIVNLIQAATLLKDIDMVKLITKLANEKSEEAIRDLLTYEMEISLRHNYGL